MEFPKALLFCESQTVVEAIEIITNHDHNILCPIIISIDELFQPIDDETLRKLNANIARPFVAAIQCKSDGSFTIVWKLQNIYSLVVFDSIDRNDLIYLCRFVVDFISRCLRENHAGETTKFLILKLSKNIKNI
jgi:hypothetical protein